MPVPPIRLSILSVLGCLTVFVGAVTAGTIPPNALLWLKADAGVSVNDQGQVSVWLDQSGNGLNATQLTPDFQPEFVAGGINGMASLLFKGGQMLATPEFPLGSTFAVFAVLQIDAGMYSKILSYASPGSDSGAVGGGFSVYSSAAPPEEAGNFITIVSLFPSQMLSLPGKQNWLGGGEPKIAGLVADGAAETVVSVNGAQEMASQEPFGELPLRPLHIGARNAAEGPAVGLKGYVAEVLIYDRRLSPDEQRQVFHYLGTKYQIGVTP